MTFFHYIYGMKRILLLLWALLPQVVLGQSKAETSQYAKLLKKPTVKAAEKFMDKFPESAYAPKVLRLRDSLLFYALNPEDAKGVKTFVKEHPESPFRELAEARIRQHNTSPLTHEEALSRAGKCLDAVGWRKDNVDYILVLADNLEFRLLEKDGTLFSGRTLVNYTLSDLPFTDLAGPIELVAPTGGRNYLHFAYYNGPTEYVEALYLPEKDILYQALFYGKVLPDGRLEGQSPEGMEGLTLTPEVAWLVRRFSTNPSLVQLTRADSLTDASLQWWQERNPKALTAQQVKLAFGKLDKDASLVEAFQAARKEKGKSYTVAKVLLRDHLAVVAKSKASGEYLLVWAEPIVKGKELRTFYFENDGTTLDLVFYQGKTMFKLKLSLASQTLYRLK